jgi:hypothetical protein
VVLLVVSLVLPAESDVDEPVVDGPVEDPVAPPVEDPLVWLGAGSENPQAVMATPARAPSSGKATLDRRRSDSRLVIMARPPTFPQNGLSFSSHTGVRLSPDP